MSLCRGSGDLQDFAALTLSFLSRVLRTITGRSSGSATRAAPTPDESVQVITINIFAAYRHSRLYFASAGG